MTISLRHMTYRFVTVLLLLGLLASCAPPPTTKQSGNQTQDMRQLLTVLDKQGQELESVSRQLAELQDQQQKQTRLPAGLFKFPVEIPLNLFAVKILYNLFQPSQFFKGFSGWY